MKNKVKIDLNDHRFYRMIFPRCFKFPFLYFAYKWDFYGLPLEREASFICLISGDHCVASRKGLHATVVLFLSLHHELLKKF